MSLCSFPSTSSFVHGLVSSPVSYACYHLTNFFSLPESSSTAPLTTSTILLCSAVSKMTASIATYPHEVVRTRLQIQRRFLPGNGVGSFVRSKSKETKGYKGLVHAARRIVQEEGWRGLYKGLSINLFRTVPNSAVTMLTFVPIKVLFATCLALTCS